MTERQTASITEAFYNIGRQLARIADILEDISDALDKETEDDQ